MPHVLTALHVLVGAKSEYAKWERAERSGRDVAWVVPKTAQPGDRALFFFPGQGLIGEGTVRAAPDGRGRGGRYVSTVGELQGHVRLRSLEELRALLPAWKWLTYPRSYTTVTGPSRQRLERVLASTARGAQKHPATRERSPSLHITFAQGADAEDLVSGRDKRPEWNAPVTARKGDTVLFYLGAREEPGLWAVGWTAEDSSKGTPSGHWTQSTKGHFARYERIHLLERPILLAELRQHFPDWARWTTLRGVRVHTVPERFRKSLAAWVLERAPRATALLAPWKGGVSPEPPQEPLDEPRYEGAVVTGTHRRYERDHELRRQVVAQRGPTCEVCGFNFERAYGPEAKGFIEVHHLKPVSGGVRKAKQEDLAILCSNCHSIAHWRRKEPHSVTALRRMVRRAAARA